MMVFWKERLAFLAVPKTGTTALEMAIGPRAEIVMRDPPQLKHMTLQRFERFMLPLFKTAAAGGFETVAIVRDPVDWLGSWFRYRQRDDITGHPNSTQGRSFDAFVEGWLRKTPPGFANVGSQARFVGDGAGAVGVTHLFRYESFGAVTGFFEARLGLKIETKALNVSPKADLTLSPHLLARIRSERAAEYAVWQAARG